MSSKNIGPYDDRLNKLKENQIKQINETRALLGLKPIGIKTPKVCMKCKREFPSLSQSHRLCNRCKNPRWSDSL